jgi:hypothetical protein
MRTLDGVGGYRHASAALPHGMTQYPLYRRLDWPKGWSGRLWKISSTLGFEPRAVSQWQVAIPTALSRQLYIPMECTVN